MVFSSVVFLFFYLPITLAAYYVAPRKWRNMLLLVVNLFFYGWGEPVYITIMLLSTLIDYTHGMLVEKYRSNDKKARMFVVSSVFFNLLLLVFFKYYDFIVTSVKAVFPGLPLEPLGIPLPIGISFYTFQTMSYTIDVYRGDARAQKNIVNFGTFVTLFPQLIAGPIVQYKDVDDQLRERHEMSRSLPAACRPLSAAWQKRCFWPTASACCGTSACKTPLHSRRWAHGWVFWPTLSRFILTFPAIPTWPLAWDGCWDLSSKRISTTPISRAQSPSSGGAGISRWAPGSANMSIFPSAAAAAVSGAPIATCSLCGR